MVNISYTKDTNHCGDRALSNPYYCPIIAIIMEPDFSGISLPLKKEEGKTKVYDPVRRKWLVLTPEEHVRQYLLQYLIQVKEYPASLIAVEKKVNVNGMEQRYDMVVFNREHKPWMLVECKAPEVPVTEAVLHQLLRYHSNLQCRYWVVCNGHTLFCADAVDYNEIKWLEDLPVYNG